jgi:hypothetical protein
VTAGNYSVTLQRFSKHGMALPAANNEEPLMLFNQLTHKS